MLQALCAKVEYEKGIPIGKIGYFNDSYRTTAPWPDSPTPAQLAAYHNFLGTGKSRIKWTFLGLTKVEKSRVANILSKKLLTNLKNF
ncbi:MAG: hypothetical protein DRP91_06415 [Candidatus Neomarinimicrobiota bacterium]|nr:MAG: hypothetical protein DRP91_06415 [Candidatus Neomarinimicrobiota bacterium]RKY53547.1 MAG: hypothetical protein DRP92_03230 [Candidatus Neomarinimicrobiota bacterium]